MAGGASGAIGFWAHETRRQVRELEQRAAAHKLRRRPRSAARTHERLALPCPWLCLECGYLEVPARAGDPMRTVSGDVAPGACRHCRARAWADLADVATSESTREIERHEALTRTWPRYTANVVLATLATGAGIASLGMGTVVGVSVFALATVAGTRAARSIAALFGSRRRTPWRWRVPALTHREGAVLACGQVQGDEILRAPLSGRPALAWRIEVGYDERPRAPLALVEQSCSVLQIDTVAVAQEPTLALPTESVTLTDDAGVHLRSRGLDPCDALWCREAIVEPGAMVTLYEDRRGGPPILR
jgi:hypothetical protein